MLEIGLAHGSNHCERSQMGHRGTTKRSGGVMLGYHQRRVEGSAKPTLLRSHPETFPLGASNLPGHQSFAKLLISESE